MRLVLMFLLLASSVLAQNAASPAFASEACGPADIEFSVKADKSKHAIGQAEAGKALIYFIEEYHSNAGGFFLPTVRLAMDGKWIGANRGGSYFSFSVEPGNHHLCASWQSPNEDIASQYSLMPFTAEAGKVYFFRIEPRAEAYHDLGDAWSKDLGPVNPDEAKYLISTLPLSISRVKK